MIARVTGTVLGTDSFSGTAKATGNPFTISTAIVLVAERETVRVNYDPARDQIVPRRGEVVDWLVDVGTYRVEPQLTYSREWPEDDAVAA